MTYKSSTGYYNPTNNELLSLEINMCEQNMPFTSVEINIIASEQFTFEDSIGYTTGAEHTITSEYEMYKRIHQETFTEAIYGYIIFENHELYLHLDMINETLFNKFI